MLVREIMATKTHLGRITAPISYLETSGQLQYIPIGPCLVEKEGDAGVDVVWGSLGESSIALAQDAIEAARDKGQLVLLD